MFCYNGNGHHLRRAFSAIELLIVISIMGMLVSLLLPAVQMAREAARLASCKNHLKQIGLACQTHYATHQHFPTGGWGFRWIGDPDRGFGSKQPGGWIFNILPYLEKDKVREMSRNQVPSMKPAEAAKMLQIVVPVLNCPSRRSAELFPFTESKFGLANCVVPAAAAKSDYAVNGGDVEIAGGPGPSSYNDRGYRWPEMRACTGISFERSRVRMADITRGSSNTLLAGEKYVAVENYRAGRTAGDDQAMYVGNDADVRRFASIPPIPDSAGIKDVSHFGGPHFSGCVFVMADGSVRVVKYDIGYDDFRKMGRRITP